MVERAAEGVEREVDWPATEVEVADSVEVLAVAPGAVRRAAYVASLGLPVRARMLGADVPALR